MEIKRIEISDGLDSSIEVSQAIIVDTPEALSESYVLVVYQNNWADEMDVMGMAIMTEESWEETKTYVKEFFTKYPGKELSHWIGTNEEITYNSYEMWEGAYTTYPIPSKEVLKFLEEVSELPGQFFEPEWYEDNN